MPIYMYRCSECLQTCEALQRASDSPLIECPHCHAKALHRIIAPCGIIFKGHGFYKTDNPSSSSGADSSSHKCSETLSEHSRDGGKKSESANTDIASPKAPVSKNSNSTDKTSSAEGKGA